MINTKFQILVEIAANQPNVRQADIADKLNITPQAVSEYFKQLLKEGMVLSEGPLNYRVTQRGVEEIIKGAQEIKSYLRFVLEDVVSDVRVFTAIAAQDLIENQKVNLWMENGLLYAGDKDSKATGTTIHAAKKGQDVGVESLKGIIELKKGTVKIFRIPRIEEGGSRNVDYDKLKKVVKRSNFTCAIGVEALISLKNINKRPKAFFGAKEAVIEASHHGISPIVVGADDEIPELLKKLEDEGITFDIIDLSMH